MRLRRFVVTVSAALAAVLAGVAGAFACVSLATLTLSTTSGPAGARVTVTGTDFAVASPAVPVVLRWNHVDGPELARDTPNAGGEISAGFSVPQAAPGYYVVIGVQRGADGQHRYGTPSRATYQIVPGPAPADAATLPTTSGSLPPAGLLPAAAADERSEALPMPAVAAAGVLLLGVALALRRQAPGR